MMIDILSDERLDDLQCKGYQIIQKPEGFCFGIDAVLLADFTKVKPKNQVLDICSGTGIIPILLAAKTKGESFIGLEIQKDYVEMANRSAKYNHIEDKVKIAAGDVKEIKSLFPAASFHVVTANPPYMTMGHGLSNPYEPKNIARHEVLLSLKDVIFAASYALEANGSFFMIHKPFRLAEIFEVMKQHDLEPKRMRLVHPYLDKEPTMVLIEGAKGGKPRITIEPPLVMYE